MAYVLLSHAERHPGAQLRSCRACIGMPSVIRVKDRLAVFYDAPGGNSVDHMRRDIGLAWLKLPLIPPSDPEGEQK